MIEKPTSTTCTPVRLRGKTLTEKYTRADTAHKEPQLAIANRSGREVGKGSNRYVHRGEDETYQIALNHEPLSAQSGETAASGEAAAAVRQRPA